MIYISLLNRIGNILKFKNRGYWEQQVAINKKSEYGMAILTLAEKWADLMEQKDISEIETYISEIETYRKACSIVDSRLTEQSLPPVVGLLAASWEYGEDLLSWHEAYMKRKW